MEAGSKESTSLTAPWGRITAVVQLVRERVTEGTTVTSYGISASAVTVGDALDLVNALRTDGRYSVPFSAPTTELAVTFHISALQADSSRRR